MKNYAKIATLLGLSVATLSASGYRIPENSLNSTALGAAYVAEANGADASYFNPANMAFMEDGAELETALTYINLSKIKYTDNTTSARSADSKEENFLVPSFHYVSPKVNDWRFGLSVVAPAGLSKRWEGVFQKIKAKEFSLEVIEINPTASYKVNDKFAVGLGLRGVYSKGDIKFQDDTNATGKGPYENNMQADSIDFGYNLALSYKATNNLTVSTTYRSKIDLTVEGDAEGWLVHPTLGYTFNTPANTKVPLPASLALATAYSFDKTTVEFVFERTYWSAYDQLHIQFQDTTIDGGFGIPSPKNWKDVNAYRLGVTHQYSDKLKLMAGFAYDENPIPDSTVSFELPDSDAKLYTAGFEYTVNDKMKVGLAYLYDEKDSRTVAGSGLRPNGTFEDASAHLVTASIKYKF